MISRTEKLVENFRKIDSVPKSRRNGSTFKNVKHFMKNVDWLFDLFLQKNSHHRRLEKNKLSTINSTNFGFIKIKRERGLANVQVF